MATTGDVRAGAIRVLVLDDHRVFSESLALSMETHPDLRCVAITHTVADSLRAAEATAFDVALIDLQLPDGDGLSAVPALLARRPQARIVVLTAHPRADLAARAVAAGAHGFLGKDAGLGEIVDAVRAAVAGQRIVRSRPEPDVHLTPREHEVLQALGRGLDATRIAATMGISLHTARDHIRAVMGKLGARTQLDAVVTAERLGLLTLGLGF